MAAGPPADGATPRRWRRWLPLAVGIWAVALVGLAVASTRWDDPTVREQHGIELAAPIVDRVTGEIAAAAGPSAVVVVAEPELAEGCRITPFRDGAELTRRLTVYTGADGGPALLGQIAGRLPDRYEPRLRLDPSRGGGSVLRADAGQFIGIRGEVRRPGVVALAVTTGCRPLPATATSAPAYPWSPADEEPARLLDVLGAIDVREEPATLLSCPDGGALRTAVAIGHGAAEPVADLLREASGGLREASGGRPTVLVDLPPVFAYRDGATGVVVEADGGEIRVTATTDC